MIVYDAFIFVYFCIYSASMRANAEATLSRAPDAKVLCLGRWRPWMGADATTTTERTTTVSSQGRRKRIRRRKRLFTQ